MRVALIKSALSKKGGLEKYTFRIASGFADQGHEVVVLTTDCKTTPSHFQIVSLGKRIASSLLHLLFFDHKCAAWLLKNPSLVVFGMDRNFCLQTHYRAGNGVHKAYLEHRKQFSSFFKRLTLKINPQHWLIRLMEKKTFESPHLKVLFTNSNLVKREIERYYPKVPCEKIEVVHNGVEWYEYEAPFQESLVKRKGIQEKLGLNPEAFQFLFVGNEYDRKGLPLLLEALAQLKKEAPTFLFELAVVGRERKLWRYMQKAKDLGLGREVRFFGEQNQVLPFYQAHDVMVIPSYYDPFANVTVEALAMGLFVVSSPLNGGSEVLIPGKNGHVFESFTPASLLKALQVARMYPKTAESSLEIRNGVQHLDFAHQIKKIVDRSLV